MSRFGLTAILSLSGALMASASAHATVPITGNATSPNTGYPFTQGAPPLLNSTIQDQYVRQLRALHDKAIGQQSLDGGELSSVHKAALQTELDRINQSYVRSMNNNNRYGFDKRGRPLRYVLQP